MKVLIFGHACSPRAGSEPGFTWNWAWNLSSEHEVFVLAYPHDRDAVESFLLRNPRKGLHFLWVDLPNQRAASTSENGLQSLSLYLRWQKLAYKKAIDFHKELGFDLVHHVSYGSISAPPPVRKLGIPFVWGPVGGGQLAPSAFRRYFGSAWMNEIVRKMRLRLLPYSPPARSAAQASLVTLATNQETAAMLRRMGARDVRLCLDSGISSDFVLRPQISARQAGDPFTLLWVGRMQPRKALPLALEGLARTNGLRVKLLIAGDGEMRKSWEECAKRLQVHRKVEFLGKVPWKEMPSFYQRADAFLFTSLRDSFGTQMLEAMAHGLPILTLNHQGAATFVPTGAGIKVPLSKPCETAAAIANGIRWLERHPETWQRMGEAGRAFARTQTWERRGAWMSKLYEEVLGRGASCQLGTPVPYGSHAIQRVEKLDEMAMTKLNRAEVKVPFHLSPSAEEPSFEVLGVKVQAVQTPDVVACMERWIHERGACRTVAATSMHGVVEARHDSTFKEILKSADAVVPDGMPLVWLGRRKGYALPRRVYGPDLMLEFCGKTAARGYRHFFYGGEPGVPELLAESLQKRFPSLQVCGTFSPPFRPLQPEEEEKIVAMINQAAPDIVWVGLGEIKQDQWMHQHKDRLGVPVLVGVGAAFDFLSGRRNQAPRWMGEHGFEWLFRLCQEPRRLWRRYLVYGTQFLVYLALAWLSRDVFDSSEKPTMLGRPERKPG